MTRQPLDIRPSPDISQDGMVITPERMIALVDLDIDLNGVDKASQKLTVLNDMFAGEDGWRDIYNAVRTHLAARKKEEDERKSALPNIEKNIYLTGNNPKYTETNH